MRHPDLRILSGESGKFALIRLVAFRYFPSDMDPDIFTDTAPKMNAPFLVAITGLILVGAPLAGTWLAGRPLGHYLELPPRPMPVEVSGFSWVAFWLMAAFILAVVAPFV